MLEQGGKVERYIKCYRGRERKRKEERREGEKRVEKEGNVALGS